MAKPKLKTNKPPKTSIQGITKRRHTRKSGALIPKLKKVKALELTKLTRGSSSPSSPEQTFIEIISDSEEELRKTFVRAEDNPIDFDQLQSGISALFEYVARVDNNKLKLLDEAQPIFLQITTLKVPRSPSRFIRFNLKHSLHSDDSEICLIVEDIGENRKEHEETTEHFENLLSEKGINFINTVIPLNQLKNEYGKQFEMKRRLLGLYDCFLVDAKISGPVHHLLGKIFQEKRRTPTPVRMNVDNLKKHLEKAVKKTLMDLHSKGDTYIVQVGHTKMTPEAVYENACGIVEELESMFPGGLDNIRALGVKTDLSINVPVFLTLKNKTKVAVPILHPKRPKNFKNVTDELSTYTNREVTVLPTGDVFVLDKKGKNTRQKTTKAEPSQSNKNGRKRKEKEVEKEQIVPEKKMKNKEDDEEDFDEEDELDADEFLEQVEARYLSEIEEEHKKANNTKKEPKVPKSKSSGAKESKATKKTTKKEIKSEEEKQPAQRPRRAQKVNGVSPEPATKSKVRRGQKVNGVSPEPAAKSKIRRGQKVNGVSHKPAAKPKVKSVQETTKRGKAKTDDIPEQTAKTKKQKKAQDKKPALKVKLGRKSGNLKSKMK